MGKRLGSLSRTRVVRMVKVMTIALAIFFISPGGAALAETIVDAVCGGEAPGNATYAFQIIPGRDDVDDERAFVLEGSVNGQTFYGYCQNLYRDFPRGCSATGGAELVPGNGASGCVAVTMPPAVPANSYWAIINNTAGALATWHFTDGLGMPTLEQAMADNDWAGGDNVVQIWANALGGYPEYSTSEQVYNDILGVYNGLVAACAGAAPVVLPTLVSQGDGTATLPDEDTIDLTFHTDAGAGVSIDITVTGATLVSANPATTDGNGDVTVTVQHTNATTGTVTAKAQIPAPAGSTVALNRGDEQDISVGGANLVFYESQAEANFTWAGSTPTPVVTPTIAPTEVGCIEVTPEPTATQSEPTATQPANATPIVDEPTPTPDTGQVCETPTPSTATETPVPTTVVETPAPTTVVETPGGGATKTPGGNSSGNGGPGNGGGGNAGSGGGPEVKALPNTGAAVNRDNNDAAYLLIATSLVLVIATAVLAKRRRI